MNNIFINNVNEKSKFILSKTNNNIFAENTTSQAKINLSEIEIENNNFVYVYSNATQDFVVITSDIEADKDKFSYYKQRYQINSLPFASIFKADDIKVLKVIDEVKVEEGVTFELAESGQISDQVSKYIPDWKQRFGAKRSAKLRLLESVSNQSVLSELEKQVDLLSEVVFALVEGNQAPSWFNDYKTAIQSTTSANSKSKQELIADISDVKSKVRTAVSNYKNEKTPRNI